jgi:hypothetical protein
MNITSEFFSFNMWEWFLHSSVLERTESDLLKINWLHDIILFYSNSGGALGQVSIVSHSYQTYFGFSGLDLNLDYELRDQVIMRFASNTFSNSDWSEIVTQGKHVRRLHVNFQPNPTLWLEIMIVAVKLDSCAIYIRIRIWFFFITRTYHIG